MAYQRQVDRMAGRTVRHRNANRCRRHTPLVIGNSVSEGVGADITRTRRIDDLAVVHRGRAVAGLARVVTVKASPSGSLSFAFTLMVTAPPCVVVALSLPALGC